MVDSLRLEDGVMVEHRDVIQDEATREGSAGGCPVLNSYHAMKRSLLVKVLCYNFWKYTLSVTPGRTIHSLPATFDDNFYSHPDYHTLEPTPAVH